METTTPNDPHYTPKEFAAMISGLEAQAEEVHAMIRRDHLSPEDHDRAMGWLIHLRENIVLEYQLAEHHAYGPFTEHPSVKRWA
jgi:prephenate dehydrogenase